MLFNGSGLQTTDVKKELQKVLAQNKLKNEQLNQQGNAANPEADTTSIDPDSLNDDDSFVVTADYIQQSKFWEKKTHSIDQTKTEIIFVSTAIKNALKQENLNPEIEEKLLNLQRYQEKQMKSEPVAVSSPVPQYSTPVKSNTSQKKRPSSRHDDDDWILETPKRRPPKGGSNSDRKSESAGESSKTVAPVEETPMNNRRLAAIKRESDKKKQQQQIQVKVWLILLNFYLMFSSVCWLGAWDNLQDFIVPFLTFSRARSFYILAFVPSENVNVYVRNQYHWGGYAISKVK